MNLTSSQNFNPSFYNKKSLISNNNSPIFINADINKYSIENYGKIIHNKYVLFHITINTSYKKWVIKKRYSNFENLHQNLKKIEKKKLPNLPPKIYFGNFNPNEINNRGNELEFYLNDLFKILNVLYYRIILDFIKMPKEVEKIFRENENINNINKNINLISYSNNLSSLETINSTKKESFFNNNNNINNNKKNIFNSNSNNYYNNILQFKICDFDNDKSPNALVIEEFLRNLDEHKDNKSDYINKFIDFLKNSNEGKWPSFLSNEINYFFNGIELNDQNNKFINGFLYHVGNIQINLIASINALKFLSNLLSQDFNPQSENFISIFRRTKLNIIQGMEIEKHILSNNNIAMEAAFKILKIYLKNRNNFEQKAKRILNNNEAEKMFLEWYYKNNE